MKSQELATVLVCSGLLVMAWRKSFVQDFKKRFSCDCSPSQEDLGVFANIIQPCITMEDNGGLMRPFTMEEIWMAAKSIGA